MSPAGADRTEEGYGWKGPHPMTVRPPAVFVALALVVTACSTSGPSEGTATDDGLPFRRPPASQPAGTEPASGHEGFVLPPAPTLTDHALSDAPSYIFLFTHTEDPFNHELSEERYWRVGDLVEEVAAAHPDVGLVWTIEFQGSDAETVTQRNPETGLVDRLLALRDEGLVQFGYHAYHDPTYLNRPQNELRPDSSFDEVHDAMWTWITCRKDVTRGGCVEERGGGLEAISNPFGQVTIVTGLGVSLGFQVERSAGALAVRELVPDRMLAFGFPDHGDLAVDRTYTAARDALLALLTPTHETSSSTFWMDGSIRINDSAPLDDVNLSPLYDGPDALDAALDSLDGSRSFVLNQGIADKFLYTLETTSPTKWGYAHPDAPELPPEYRQPASERERRYRTTAETLRHLAERMDSSGGALRFVDAADVVGLFTSEDYWNVDDDELDQMAAWLLNNWTDTPPAWTYDGEDFYSLADTFALLAARAGGETADDIVSRIHGPWTVTRTTTAATSVAADDLTLAAQDGLISSSRISESYRVGSQELTATQLLYALAYLRLADRQGVDLRTVPIPATATGPETLELLNTLGCTDCLDTAWSLKPARFQD
ncbi:MAG: hypothetical protein D6683_10225 [Actinomyces sp.]|nr:MAG: hypothetical protein D6683_10225 [Actinomyces sp.]